jgi:hypothetical protein
MKLDTKHDEVTENHTKELHEISTSFAQTLQESQTSTNNAIQILIEQSENKLQQQLNDHLELILGKLTRQESPTRKKQTIQ